MVTTSTTQWTIPLSRSSLSASSPSRQNSVLGLKTCLLSAPQHATMTSSSEPHRHSHNQDLHSTSSRRLQAAEYVASRRSAGSFRQLVPEQFFAKVERADSPCRELSPNKAFEHKYDGIAMPCCRSLCTLEVGKAFGTALHGNLINLHGDITADDVDLLPIPGLLNCPSPLVAASSYVTHAQNPKSYRNAELDSTKSSGSSKPRLVVPNHLGLPPEFDGGVTRDNRTQECAGFVDSMCQVSAPLTPSITLEHARCGERHLISAGHIQNGEEVDNFADSLAGLWSTPSGTDQILQDSENLASIFNVYPQNFHGLPPSEQNGTCNTESAQCIMDGLQCIMNSSTEDRNGETGKGGRDMFDGPSPVYHGFSVNDLGDSMVWEVDPGHNSPRDTASHPCASELKGSVNFLASDGSAVPHASSLSHCRSYAELASPMKIGELISLKRPFSALDLAIMSSSVAQAGSCSSCKEGTVIKSQESDRFGSILYEPAHNPKLVGNLHYHFASRTAGNAGEEMVPTPPPAKIRRKHGTAMDPQSVAARTRREKFSDRIRTLQSLVPNGERLDTVSMLSQTLEYVKFLQHQVWHLYHGKDPASITDTCEKWKDFVEAVPALAD